VVLDIKKLDSGPELYADVLPFIQDRGLTISINGTDGENAGRTMDLLMHRDLLGYKLSVEVNFRPLDTRELQYFLNILLEEFFNVRITDPRFGITETVMYVSKVPSTLMAVYENGQEKWTGVSFSMVER